MNNEKYTLVGVDGNAFTVMGYVVRAMKREGKTREQIEAYRKDAMSSDYYHLLAVSTVTFENLNK